MTSPLTSTPPPFLVLPENRFAHAALTAQDRSAQSVFLFGPSGVGKSCLAEHAIARAITECSRTRVQQMTASQFAAEFGEAAANRTVPLFQSLTRKFDLFILEDLHALEGRPETQTQLLSQTNELLAIGCRIVWTSRKSPGELVQFQPKLISRFRAGVLAPIRMPGENSRRDLLTHFAQSSRIAISSSAVRHLATGMAVSPRELRSALNRLAVLARHDRRAIDTDLVRKFLAHDFPPAPLKLDDICRAVARQFGTTAGELRSRKRARSAALPRQCAMFLSRELTSASLQQIGAFFGKRDHSTVVHACQRLVLLLESDRDLPTNLNQIRHALGVLPPNERNAL